MTMAVRVLRNPADPINQRYVVYDNGLIEARGGAIPITGTPTYYNVPPSSNALQLGPMVSMQVIDWTVPSGYVVDWAGTVTAFGGVTAPASQAAGVPFTAFGQVAPICCDFMMNPAGNGQGYVLTLAGAVLKLGGAPDVQVPWTYSLGGAPPWARRLRMDYATKRYYVMTTQGGVVPWEGAGLDGVIDGTSYGVPACEAGFWSQQNATSFWITDYAHGTGWIMQGDGAIHSMNGAGGVGGEPLWPGGQRNAMDFFLLDDGTGADPFIYETLDWTGTEHVRSELATPTAALTAPTGTITTTTRPTISWTYNNLFADAQGSYDIRVFTAAQHGIGGFDPATSPFTFQITDNDPNTRSVEMPADLLGAQPATWWVYIQVWGVGYGSLPGLPSAWVGASWIQNVAIPAAPTLTATYGADALAGITLVAHTAGAPTAGTLFAVQYRDSSSDPWRWVRGGEGTTPDVAHNFTVVDTEARFGVARSYRAVAYQINANSIIASAFSATATATIADRTTWTLTCPQNKALGAAIHVAPDFEWDEVLDGTAWQPAGEQYGIVMVDDAPVKALTAQLTLMLPIKAAYDLLRPMLALGTELLLRDPFGRAWYVIPASGQSSGKLEWHLVAVPPEDCSDEDQPSGAGFYHQVTLPIVEVANPRTTALVLDRLLA